MCLASLESERRFGMLREAYRRSCTNQRRMPKAHHECVLGVLNDEVRLQELNGEVSRSSHECTVLRKELEEHKSAADRRQQRLLEDLRQTEDQRAHLDKLYHTSTEKVAEVESELAHVRQDLSHQVKVLKDKLEKETADKNHQQVGKLQIALDVHN